MASPPNIGRSNGAVRVLFPEAHRLDAVPLLRSCDIPPAYFPHYSPPFPPPILPRLIVVIDLLRQSHLHLHHVIEERRYRAENEIADYNLRFNPQTASRAHPPSPKKEVIQASLASFYKEIAASFCSTLPETSSQIDRRTLRDLSTLISRIGMAIQKTREDFTTQATVRCRGLEARIHNDTGGNTTYAHEIFAEMTQFEQECQGNFDLCNEYRRQLSEIVITNTNMS